MVKTEFGKTLTEGIEMIENLVKNFFSQEEETYKGFTATCRKTSNPDGWYLVLSAFNKDWEVFFEDEYFLRPAEIVTTNFTDTMHKIMRIIAKDAAKFSLLQ
jgi:hypothetical protein